MASWLQCHSMRLRPRSSVAKSHPTNRPQRRVTGREEDDISTRRRLPRQNGFYTSGWLAARRIARRALAACSNRSPVPVLRQSETDLDTGGVGSETPKPSYVSRLQGSDAIVDFTGVLDASETAEIYLKSLRECCSLCCHVRRDGRSRPNVLRRRPRGELPSRNSLMRA